MPEALDWRPICADCAHCHSSISSINHGHKTCNRRIVDDCVDGPRVAGRPAAFERAWLWHWLGMGTCGPKGRYWAPARQPAPPVGGSAVLSPRGR